jgi:putative flippase GtrA
VKYQKLFTILRHSTLLRYGVIGGTSASFDFVIFAFLFNVVGINPIIANVFSTACGIVLSFYLNAYFNFKRKDKLWKRFALFFTVGMFGLILGSVLVYIIHDRLGVDANIAKIISIPIVVLLQYIFNKKFSFSANPDTDFRTIGKWFKRHWIDVVVIILTSIVFLGAVFFHPTVDDVDNLLGGTLVGQGVHPYVGFFSHHAPGMYYLSWFIQLFTGPDLFWFRFVFNLILITIVVVTYCLLRHYRIHKLIAITYIGLMALMNYIALSAVPLGESVVAVLLPLVLTILFLGQTKGRPLSLKMVIICSILISAMPVLALSYALPAGVLYIPLTIAIGRGYFGIGQCDLVGFLKALLAMFMPVALLVICLGSTGLLGPMYDDVVTFNNTIYAPMMGQQTNGILGLLIMTLKQNMTDILGVVSSIPDTYSLLSLVFILAVAFFITRLVLIKDFIAATAIIFLFLLSIPLINLYNISGLTGDLSNLSNQASVYVHFICFAFVMGPLYWLVTNTNEPNTRKKMMRIVLWAYSLIFIISTIVAVSFVVIRDVRQSRVTYYEYAQQAKKNATVTLANSLLNTRSSYWIGPLDFESQLYIKAHRATKYSFYAAWIDSSPKHRMEFLEQLREQKPEVVFFSRFYYRGVVYNYSQELRSILEDNYYQVANEKFENVYFLKDEREYFTKKLRELGYE